ncbi:MAG TPA: DUF3052 domain-containing protein [Burkholderiaceae bacterium]|nr:DUF3052 domain-containing protein [Burkholderiaceae bacterium]
MSRASAMASPNAGYSGTPLVKKLGIRGGMTVQVIDAPAPYERIVDGLPPDLRFVARTTTDTQFVHAFVTDPVRLQRALSALREKLPANAVVWVSWPKKASGIATDVDESAVRRIALPLGWVDVKVCAVDATWSGLKLVVRKALRQR